MAARLSLMWVEFLHRIPSRSGLRGFLTLGAAAGAPARSGYRADIDGLRGIAVLAVIATHAGIPGFAGGFVGVDMFFVISGYLITRNLEGAPRAGVRGLLVFYGRRTRRTLPALYLVAAVTLATGFFLLLPAEFDDLARSLVAALLFVPNILFLTQAGYFDHAAVTKPLLHTWSLGVEEQFYLVAPLLPFALRKLSLGPRKVVLAGLFVVALAVCVGLRPVAPAAAFYLMPARLWEFLAGALVAEGVFANLRIAWLTELVGGLALLGLAVAIGSFTAETPHPGLPTLLPCLATAAIIQIGETRSTLAGRLLGSRALAGIGLISYSLYLWHWPLLVFGRLAAIPEFLTSWLVGAVALLGLSWLSWRYVEVPFRAAGSPLRRQAGRLLPSAAACLVAACAIVVVGRGLPRRFPADVAAVAGYSDYADRRQYREGSCFLTSKFNEAGSFDRATCLHKATDRPNYLIIGDSHAAHLWFGFKTVFKDANIMQATASGCRPLLHPVGKPYCTALMNEVMDSFLPKQSVDIVFLSAAWEYADVTRLPETVAYLQHFARKVIVVGAIPTHTEALPLLLARSMLQGSDQVVRDHEPPWMFEMDAPFEEVLPAGSYVSLIDGLCPNRKCTVWAGKGIPLQFDTGHLTSEGSALVARYIDGTKIRELR